MPRRTARSRCTAAAAGTALIVLSGLATTPASATGGTGFVCLQGLSAEGVGPGGNNPDGTLDYQVGYGECLWETMHHHVADLSRSRITNSATTRLSSTLPTPAQTAVVLSGRSVTLRVSADSADATGGSTRFTEVDLRTRDSAGGYGPDVTLTPDPGGATLSGTFTAPTISDLTTPRDFYLSGAFAHVDSPELAHWSSLFWLQPYAKTAALVHVEPVAYQDLSLTAPRVAEYGTTVKLHGSLYRSYGSPAGRTVVVDGTRVTTDAYGEFTVLRKWTASGTRTIRALTVEEHGLTVASNTETVRVMPRVGLTSAAAFGVATPSWSTHMFANPGARVTLTATSNPTAALRLQRWDGPRRAWVTVGSTTSTRASWKVRAGRSHTVTHYRLVAARVGMTTAATQNFDVRAR